MCHLVHYKCSVEQNCCLTYCQKKGSEIFLFKDVFLKISDQISIIQNRQTVAKQHIVSDLCIKSNSLSPSIFLIEQRVSKIALLKIHAKIF